MIGVNDLAKRWDNTDAAMGERYMGRVDAAADLVMLAETAWKPVSEPPTEADGDVLLMWSDGDLSLEDVDIVRSLTDTGLFWAWPCDVVLMPPQGGE